MEQWKPILSLGSNYEASSKGRIRRATASRGTKIGRIITSGVMPSGYIIASVQINRKTTTFLVHRLVAEAFIGPIPDGLEVNHKDSNKANNHPENLEYVTRSENLIHAIESTGAYRGERNSQAIITEDIVRDIRKQHASGLGYKRLAKHFGLSWSLVREVATRRTWKHIQ